MGTLGRGKRKEKEIGVAKLPNVEYFETDADLPSEKKLRSLASYLQDFEFITADEETTNENGQSPLPEGYKYGIKYTTFNFYAPKFITFLKRYLEDRGATFVRKRLEHIDEAFNLFGDENTGHSGKTESRSYNSDNCRDDSSENGNGANDTSTQVVFNCTGLGAQTLGGVCDKKVYPTRGQVVIVRAPHIHTNMAAESQTWSTYVIPRPYSLVGDSNGSDGEGENDKNIGQVILGGFMQKGSYDALATYSHETCSILERTLKLLPAIDDYGRKPVEVLNECAGLRPSRVGGARIEKEIKEMRRDMGGRGIKRVLIHNYGAGGTGYQSGYGMAMMAVKLMNEGNYKL